MHEPVQRIYRTTECILYKASWLNLAAKHKQQLSALSLCALIRTWTAGPLLSTAPLPQLLCQSTMHPLHPAEPTYSHKSNHVHEIGTMWCSSPGQPALAVGTPGVSQSLSVVQPIPSLAAQPAACIVTSASTYSSQAAAAATACPASSSEQAKLLLWLLWCRCGGGRRRRLPAPAHQAVPGDPVAGSIHCAADGPTHLVHVHTPAPDLQRLVAKRSTHVKKKETAAEMRPTQAMQASSGSRR